MRSASDPITIKDDNVTSATAVSRSLIGHAGVLDRLGRAFRRGRLVGAFLFVGPEGIGKRAAAERIAAGLLCQKQRSTDLAPCGACDSCTLIESGGHPDLLDVARPKGKSGIPIAALIGSGDERNRVGLCHDLALRPMVAERRVAIIDDADTLGVEGANCLLKTLEEPPPRSVMILIGTSLAKQLPTIRSRTQVVRFDSLSTEQVLRILRREAPDHPDGDLEQAARESRGSVSRALALMDPTLRHAIEAVGACLAASRVEAARFASVLEGESKAAGKEPSARRERLAFLLDAATTHCRDRLCQLSAEYAPREELEAASDALAACVEASGALGRNANQGALLQRLAIDLSRLA